jgi:SAM-dependent methyltransferase
MSKIFKFAKFVYHLLPLPLATKEELKAEFRAWASPLAPAANAEDSAQCVDVNQKDHKQKMLSHISPAVQDGLEIGALYRPTVTKLESGGRIYYVDFTTTEELRKYYRNHPVVKADDIVETDYVWGDKSFAESVGDKRFDYMLASHVIEHVPDMLGWLKEIAEVLKDGGILSLVIPDKRYTYDHWRELTTPGMLIEAYLLHRRRPGPRAIFDHYALTYEVNLEAAWKGQINKTIPMRPENLPYALNIAQDSLSTEHYHDVHVNVFTPTHFFHLLEIASHLELLDFSIVDFYDTAVNALEFFVSLERVPRGQTRQDILAKQLASLTWARQRMSNVDLAARQSA